MLLFLPSIFHVREAPEGWRESGEAHRAWFIHQAGKGHQCYSQAVLHQHHASTCQTSVWPKCQPVHAVHQPHVGSLKGINPALSLCCFDAGRRHTHGQSAYTTTKRPKTPDDSQNSFTVRLDPSWGITMPNMSPVWNKVGWYYWNARWRWQKLLWCHLTCCGTVVSLGIRFDQIQLDEQYRLIWNLKKGWVEFEEFHSSFISKKMGLTLE